jgi:hypothetical protein
LVEPGSEDLVRGPVAADLEIEAAVKLQHLGLVAKGVRLFGQQDGLGLSERRRTLE